MNQAESRRRQVSAFTNVIMLVIWFTVGKMIGENATTYVAVALAVSQIAGALVSGGVADVLGRLLRGRRNKGQHKCVSKMQKCVLIFQAALGLTAGLLLFLLAHVIAENVLQVKYCAIIIRMFAPYILFRALSEVLSGFFQGEGMELPVAGIGVLRAFFILLFSMLFTNKLGNYGEKVSVLLQQEDFAAMYMGLAIALAVCVAELICAILLCILYQLFRTGKRKARQEGMRATDSWMDIIRYLTGNRFPAVLSEILLCIPLLIGAFYWNGIASAEVEMTAVYGLYIGKYIIFALGIVILLYAFSLPILGKTFGYIKKEDKRYARMVFQSGVHTCMVQGIFCSVFAAVTAEQIAAVFTKTDTVLLAEMLRAGSCVIGLGGLCFYFYFFLHTMGKKYILSGVVAIAVAVYIVSAVVMLRIGNGNVMWPVYGGVGSLFIVCVLLGILSYRTLRMRMDWIRICVIPLGSACVVGLLCILMAKGFTPHLGNGFTLLVTFIPAMFLYWVILLLLRNFKEQELDVIVGGRLINALGQLLRVY